MLFSVPSILTEFVFSLQKWTYWLYHKKYVTKACGNQDVCDAWELVVNNIPGTREFNCTTCDEALCNSTVNSIAFNCLILKILTGIFVVLQL
jgi:hypothetical protein